MHRRTSRALANLLFGTAVLLGGCKPSSKPDLSDEIAKLNVELDGSRQRMVTLEKDLKAWETAAARLKTEVDEAKQAASDRDELIAKKDEQARAFEEQISALKKSDAFAFADIAAVQQKGLNSTAIDRYRKFATDFPQSPLAPLANLAVSNLTPIAEEEARFRTTMTDPKRAEREILSRFADGLVSVEEMAPLLKGKTSAEVVKLLGSPSSSFRNGTELGYANKLIDTAAGGKETLVITFDEKGVASLRMGYRGRPLRP